MLCFSVSKCPKMIRHADPKLSVNHIMMRGVIELYMGCGFEAKDVHELWVHLPSSSGSLSSCLR